MKKVIKLRHDKFAGVKLEGFDVSSDALPIEFIYQNIGWSDNRSFAKQIFLSSNVVLICDQRGLEKRMPKVLEISQSLPYSQKEIIYGDCVLCFFSGLYYGFDDKEFIKIHQLFEGMIA